MSTALATAPSPGCDHREAFGHWLSGFTDGEGSFYLRVHRRPARILKRNPSVEYTAGFVIGLRDDDRAILEAIRDYLGCGHVYQLPGHTRRGNTKPSVHFKVYALSDLITVMIPHFERHHLRAKKRRDYEIWKQGVELAYQVSLQKLRTWGYRKGTYPRWGSDERSAFVRLATLLANQRKYPVSPQTPPPPVGDPGAGQVQVVGPITPPL